MRPGPEERFLRHLRRAGGRLIGDDAALAGDRAVTLDHQVAGVHYPPDLAPRLVGRRLVRVNLSDLAAVGAAPELAFLALAAPPRFDRRALVDGVLAECRRFGLELAGGDVAAAPQPVLSMTLWGRRRPRRRWVRRTGGRPGDALWLGGAVGESAAGRLLVERGARPAGRGVRLPKGLVPDRRLAGAARRAVLRHLLPEPQLDLGAWLAARRRAAAIDVSDGLALDCHRLCHAGGHGAEIQAAELPAAAGFDALARRLGAVPRELALAGGEDYVLLFAVPPAIVPPAALGCRRIGRLTASPGVTLRDGRRRRALAARGWDQLRRRR